MKAAEMEVEFEISFNPESEGRLLSTKIRGFLTFIGSVSF